MKLSIFKDPLYRIRLKTPEKVLYKLVDYNPHIYGDVGTYESKPLSASQDFFHQNY